MKLSSSIVTMMILLPAAINAFTFNSFNIPSPVIEKLSRDTSTNKKPFDSGTTLNVELTVGKDDTSRLSLHDGSIQLLSDNISKNQAKHYTSLPGANGPNPKSSTGAKHLNVVSPPSFVDMSGKQIVHLENGSWEIVWRDNAPSGSLICGFHLNQSYWRNDAMLPEGRLYISFPVWTMESLEEQLALKRNAQKRGSELLQKKADALLQYTTEPNLFKKALHYREALAAAENYSFMAHYHIVPEKAETAILQDDILLSTKGTVWTKKDGGMFANHRQVLLGSATIRPSTIEDEVMETLRP
jgi:hypothetical protein